MRGITVALASAVLLAAVPAVGQDLAGTWNITSETLLEGEQVFCVYSGGGVIEQDDGTVGGTITLSLESGPSACPHRLQGTLSGKVGDGIVSGTITDPDLGQLSFVGGLADVMAPALKADAEVIEGEQTIVSGPFSGEGTWTAMIVAPMSALPPWALGLLALLVAAAGTVALRRRRA